MMTLTASMQDSWHQLECWAGRHAASARGEAKLVSARAECLQQAIQLSEGLAVYRILRDFHELDLNEVVNDIVAVLRQCLIVMLTTTGGGALIGGIAGGVFGVGVGAIPGVAIGAGAGAQMGEWILIFMGLKALSEYIVKDMPDIARRYWDGIRMAASAATRPQLPQQPVIIDRFTLQIAADTLARAHVSLFVLLLMGILAYLAKGRGNMGELAASVRGSKMGPKFADWMARNEGKLKADNRLRPAVKADNAREFPTMGSGSGTNGSPKRRYPRAASSEAKIPPQLLPGESKVSAPSATDHPIAAEAFHVTSNPRATQGVLDGIDPAFLNPNSRFGAAFYLAEDPETAMSELAFHGAQPSTAIRFSMNRNTANVLDLTDTNISSAWSYAGGPITAQTQAIGRDAINNGFNVIRFYSERSPGAVNYAVLDDFEEILTPTAVSPAKP
ncbi:RES family NAD+ phosphorylase [Rhodanobacter sp. AS-Z3]|uniref:RES family NAD+ phosphorylase n=1 Tax=Rhodanobacter sp. AS-Z3 TaxID=3031330 RepID=UPI002478B6A0|nr:RES family NAD+ phosphorylase [Rhodanobacter sp. AS-Z3]WEN14802.1 RES family NAD+ phosphorylase [Rhodanobacter sp. AS-Z3]